MSLEPLTEKNWKLVAARGYNNVQCCGIDEFEQDLKRLKYIKKAVTRYITTGELTERLILNHLIVLCNVFGPTLLCRIAFLKLQDQLPYVKPFLVLLSILPEVVQSVGKDGKDWVTDDIPMDPGVVKVLRQI